MNDASLDSLVNNQIGKNTNTNGTIDNTNNSLIGNGPTSNSSHTQNGGSDDLNSQLPHSQHSIENLPSDKNINELKKDNNLSAADGMSNGQFKVTDIFLKSDIVKESEISNQFEKDNAKFIGKHIQPDGTIVYDTDI